jgi:lipopolysaccharide transport system ATP-binding protein
MSSEAGGNDLAVSVRGLGKCYQIYDRPQDRLKQAVLRWRRRYYREFWALRDVSFEIGHGEAIGIIGRNGSGKSTLLQIIAGTLSPTEGDVRVQGRVAALLELGSGFNPDFTGRENVYMNGAILGLTTREIDERFDAIASFADIGEFLEQPIKTYSSGMVVRLAFAVQVQVEPDILIVDEALSVGDALFQKRCFQKMEELRASGVTLLFVSHDQETVRTLTSRAILLECGRMRSYGSAADVVLEYRRLLHEEEKRYFGHVIEKAQARQKERTAPVAVVSPRPGGDDTAAKEKPSDRLSFGDYDAEVEHVEVFDANGESASVFRPGDRMTIRVHGRVHKNLTHLNVAVRIRNKEGVKVYSWGTLNQDIAIWAGRADGAVFWDRSFRAGAAITVDFECDCPLGVNFYEVQAAISEEKDRHYTAQRMLHWRDEAAFFQVTMARQEYFFGGLCDLRMRAYVRD